MRIFFFCLIKELGFKGFQIITSLRLNSRGLLKKEKFLKYYTQKTIKSHNF